MFFLMLGSSLETENLCIPQLPYPHFCPSQVLSAFLGYFIFLSTLDIFLLLVFLPLLYSHLSPLRYHPVAFPVCQSPGLCLKQSIMYSYGLCICSPLPDQLSLHTHSFLGLRLVLLPFWFMLFGHSISLPLESLCSKFLWPSVFW